jgi:lipopolysaccharide transport system ATP-binding protein
MPFDDIAISVRNLTKAYRIFGHPGDRLKQAVTFGLRRYHREFIALNDVSFDVKRGEIVAIVGRNGSGKSTLLQLVCGILKPTAGTVRINGRVSALLELGAGFNPEFTGRENIYFQGALMGLTEPQIDAHFDDITAFADIGAFLDEPMRAYSSGMFVRLAFAVAISFEPDILVIDEALAVGDIAFQAKCMSALRQCRDRGVPILFVSHDLNAVRALCDRALYLERGEVKTIGNAATVAEAYWRDTRVMDVSNEDSSNVTASEAKLNLDQEFGRRVERFRQGTGEVSFTNVELLDENNSPCLEANCEQAVRVRMQLTFNVACEVAVSYYFRDERQLLLAGSTTVLEGYGLVSGNQGDKKVVEFVTTVPFTEGVYNVLAVLSFPLVPNQSAKFVDFVENAFVFQVRERAPVKLWSKLYIKNRVSVRDA